MYALSLVYTSTHMYSLLYFTTHVHNVCCNTASQANMEVDRLFVHPKTAHIVPKKGMNCSSTLRLWHIVQSVCYNHFFEKFCPHYWTASPETYISSSVTFWPPICGPFWPIHGYVKQSLDSWDFWSKSVSDLQKRINLPPAPLPMLICVWWLCLWKSTYL